MITILKKLQHLESMAILREKNLDSLTPLQLKNNIILFREELSEIILKVKKIILSK